jgi:hypothetical protein
LKPDDLLDPRTEVRDEKSSLPQTRNSAGRHYIVRMIKPKLHRFLTTGMFNLIVKDP